MASEWLLASCGKLSEYSCLCKAAEIPLFLKDTDTCDEDRQKSARSIRAEDLSRHTRKCRFA